MCVVCILYYGIEYHQSMAIAIPPLRIFKQGQLVQEEPRQKMGQNNRIEYYIVIKLSIGYFNVIQAAVDGDWRRSAKFLLVMYE
jgi:hypothetical protein